MSLSPRVWYGLLAILVMAAFVGTGIYYFVLKTTPPPETTTTIALATPIPTETPLATTPPSATPQPETATAPIPAAQCYEACQFSYQCADDLECLDIGGIRRCAQVDCPENDTCGCESESEIEATPTAELTPTPIAAPDLPRAGNQYLTLAILMVALFSSGISIYISVLARPKQP